MIHFGKQCTQGCFNVSDAPCTKVKMPLNKWIEQTKEAMKDMHIYIKPGKKAVVGNMEYFCIYGAYIQRTSF